MAFFESIAAHKESGSLLAAWVIEGESAGAKALFARKAEKTESLYLEEGFPEEGTGLIEEGAFSLSEIAECDRSKLFLEPVSPERRLVICGAGHVAISVIRLGVMLNYEVTVIDDREFFTQKAKDAGAHRVICGSFHETLDKLEGDFSTAFIVMTREHRYDVDCLRLILKKPFAYIGMMGSRSRSGQIRQLLTQEGLDAGIVQKVHMPIGLPIGSRTPEEIAVSVMAEVISVMNTADCGEGFPPGMLKELTALETTASRSVPTAVLAMIVEKRQEAPRKPGTKMLVKKDGSFLGTIGGGTAEALILENAGKMLREGQRECRLLSIVLEKGAMYCGGEIEVFLYPM